MGRKQMPKKPSLLEWARKQGAHWSSNLEVREGERGRGVFASVDISQGDLLLRLPICLAIKSTGCSELL